MNHSIPISPTSTSTLLELAAKTGQLPGELLDVAVEEFRQRLSHTPIAEVPGVNPADVWEAAKEADAGKLSKHSEVFTRLRSRR